MDDAIAKALAEVGVSADVGRAADTTRFDEILRSNAAGCQAGTPVLRIDGAAIFGPVLSSIPRGHEAAQLFDAVRVLTGCTEFFELKRTLTGSLNFARQAH